MSVTEGNKQRVQEVIEVALDSYLYNLKEQLKDIDPEDADEYEFQVREIHDFQDVYDNITEHLK